MQAAAVTQVTMGEALRTIQKKRTANFREDETRLLIQLWGSPSIQNKLFLTHRKAPVMRLLAANMQQRGFYRTPDEIKTRIRNLKCLYHRIKRSMSNGTGIGTVDPDWPHFKSMDEILSKEYPRKLTDRILEEQMETKFEDIKVKQEIDDIDIDDNDSWATNDSANSEYEDDGSQPASPMAPMVSITKPPLIQQGSIQVKKTSSLQAQPLQQIRLQTPGNAHTSFKHIPIQPAIKPNTIVPMSTIQLPTSQMSQNGQVPGQKGGIPFPLLILNNLNNNNADKNAANRIPNILGQPQQKDVVSSSLLKELIELQKQNLELSKEHLEIEKQRLEFDRVIGTQMVTMLPMLGGVLQRLAYPGNQDLIDMKFDVTTGVKRKRSASEDADVIKDSKKLRNMLEKGIRKYMLMDDDEPKLANNPGVEKVENKSVSGARSDKSDEDGELEVAILCNDNEKNTNSEDKDDSDDLEVSIDGDILEPNVVIENDEDNEDQDDDETENNENRNDDEEEDDDDDDDDGSEKLVIETRRSPRAARRSN